MTQTKRCDGCAFTPGTEANLSVHTLLKAKICAELAHPFYCHTHLDEDGKPIKGARLQLCGGFVDAMNAYYRRGPGPSDARRRVLVAGLELIDFGEGQGSDDTTMRRVVRLVRRSLASVDEAPRNGAPV